MTVHGKIETAEEALAVLKEARSANVDEGTRTAIRLAKANGTVTSRDVWSDMKARGVLDESVGAFWLGAVFPRSIFEWTGDYLTYSDPERNTHRKEVRIWRLSAEAVIYG